MNSGNSASSGMISGSKPEEPGLYMPLLLVQMQECKSNNLKLYWVRRGTLSLYASAPYVMLAD